MRAPRSVMAAALAALVSSGMALADPPPPPRWENDAISVPPTITKDLVRELRLGAFTARFEETALHEIRGILGDSSEGHSGDASESIRWLCYSLPGQLVWLIGTEMSGGREMDAVMVESVSDSDERLKSCPAIPTDLRPVSFAFGWIGSAETDIHSSLGKPSGFRDDWQVFFFAGKASLNEARDAVGPSRVQCEVIGYVEAQVNEGKVTSIRASHVTTDCEPSE